MITHGRFEQVLLCLLATQITTAFEPRGQGDDTAANFDDKFNSGGKTTAVTQILSSDIINLQTSVLAQVRQSTNGQGVVEPSISECCWCMETLRLEDEGFSLFMLAMKTPALWSLYYPFRLPRKYKDCNM